SQEFRVDQAYLDNVHPLTAKIYGDDKKKLMDIQTYYNKLNAELKSLNALLSAIQDTLHKSEMTEASVDTNLKLNIPDEFVKENQKFISISAGSRNGNLEAWAIDKDGAAFRYDIYAGTDMPSLENVNPWLKKEVVTKENGKGSLINIAASSYGDLVGINSTK